MGSMRGDVWRNKMKLEWVHRLAKVGRGAGEPSEVLPDGRVGLIGRSRCGGFSSGVKIHQFA
jgi:hypothetical protein